VIIAIHFSAEVSDVKLLDMFGDVMQ